MKLHEFKQQLESDATKRADQQAVTIRELNAKIQQQAEQIRHLENRCWCFGRGLLCSVCGYLGICGAKRKLGDRHET